MNMRILSNYNLSSLKQHVEEKAKYQKVVICIDETSDMDMINEIQAALSRDVIILKYVYNLKTLREFNQMLNDGVRLVIYNISSNHFCVLRQSNNLILNIFIPTSKFILPYMINTDCVYGDNILIFNNCIVDYAGVMVLYYSGLSKVWADLQAGEKVNLNIFKSLDALINNPSDFCNRMLECVNLLVSHIDNGVINIEEEELPYNIYLRSCAIFNMLEKIDSGEYDCIDFYKAYNSHEDILKAYELIVKCELMDLIKYYSNNLIKLNLAILNRFKIILKKYFTFKNINLNKINNRIKNNAKLLKIDNLLYISHIFNAI